MCIMSIKKNFLHDDFGWKSGSENGKACCWKYKYSFNYLNFLEWVKIWENEKGLKKTEEKRRFKSWDENFMLIEINSVFFST